MKVSDVVESRVRFWDVLWGPLWPPKASTSQFCAQSQVLWDIRSRIRSNMQELQKRRNTWCRNIRLYSFKVNRSLSYSEQKQKSLWLILKTICFIKISFFWFCWQLQTQPQTEEKRLSSQKTKLAISSAPVSSHHILLSYGFMGLRSKIFEWMDG